MISKRWFLLTSIFALSFVMLTTLHVAAQDRAVDLEEFIVEPTQDGRIELFFETGSENDTADFFFVRANSEDDPVFTFPHPTRAISVTYNGVETRFIEALGNAGSGEKYTAFDEDVVNGEQYCYMIGEREFDGSDAYFLDDIRCATVGDLAFSSLTATASTVVDEPGATVTHLISITNNGNRDQEFVVSVSGNEWDTDSEGPSLAISSGATATRTFTVTIPTDAAAGASDTANVLITLKNPDDRPPHLPDYSITTTLTTRVPGTPQFPLYLPYITDN